MSFAVTLRQKNYKKLIIQVELPFLALSHSTLNRILLNCMKDFSLTIYDQYLSKRYTVANIGNK